MSSNVVPLLKPIFEVNAINVCLFGFGIVAV